MTTLLESLGSAVWRASWQGAVLALLVALTLRACGDHLAPRWRFLMWGVVLTRLMFIAVPSSPWSLFNFVPSQPVATFRTVPSAEPERIAPQRLPEADEPGSRVETATEPLPAIASLPEPAAATVHLPVEQDRPEVRAQSAFLPGPVEVARLLPALWLAGSLAMGLRLLAAAFVLRRRLSVCRPATDPELLALLKSCGRRTGLRPLPALLVTPEPFGPCVIGIWSPRIVLPEAVVTESSPERVRHVLAHELAHVVRGDLWTNWLLLTVRVLHWFNPVAWWAVRAAQAEREAACDELAFTTLGETDRPAYAATIVELAASLVPTSLAPGLIGLFAEPHRLQSRVERFLRAPATRPVRAPLATALLVGIALLGLTDAMPGVRAQAPAPAVPDPVAVAPDNADRPTEATPSEPATFTLKGECVDFDGEQPLSGVTIRLYRADGRVAPPVEVATTITGKDGRYRFAGLAPPRPENHFDRRTYTAFGFLPGRPVGVTFHSFRQGVEVVQMRMASETSTLTGRVVDAAGKPVAEASVVQHQIDGRAVPGLPVVTTDRDGRFKLDRVPVYRLKNGSSFDTYFQVMHPDHPATSGKGGPLPADVVVTLPPACVIAGTVLDSVTGQPAAGALITARRTDDRGGEETAGTDAGGRFRVLVPEGRYHVVAEAADRVCVAATDQECVAGSTVELPPLTLIAGGFISGRVLNTATGEPVTVTKRGDPVALGLFGPSQPAGHVIGAQRLALVDATGKFTLRAAPGENFPYLINTRGDRMTWTTRDMPAVIVKAGETTSYDMLVTPEVPPDVKLEAARKIVAALPKPPLERTEGILVEFRKLSRTIDEEELWCMLMRELVAIGPDAVPPLCAELDRTTADRTLRRLAFALRAIGDPRAVPALVRAIPRTLVPSSSDYGLLVADNELTEFMKRHDINAQMSGQHFDMGRPVREVFFALHALTRKNFEDSELFGISLSEDPRRQVLQRRLYQRQAQRWQFWWDTNAATFTDDPGYQTCELPIIAEAISAAPDLQALPKTARIIDTVTGRVVSPAAQGGQHAWHFCDLDTGYQWKWPADIPQDDTEETRKALADWAAKSGADLMCAVHRSPDGAETYALRGFGMTVREISSRDLRNLDRLVAAGAFPEGRPVDDLLMHYDADTKALVPDANGAFVYVTREGNLGVIEVTDRVIRTADLTGQLGGSAPAGVGFHKGVRFNLKIIVP